MTAGLSESNDVFTPCLVIFSTSLYITGINAISYYIVIKHHVQNVGPGKGMAPCLLSHQSIQN